VQQQVDSKSLVKCDDASTVSTVVDRAHYTSECTGLMKNVVVNRHDKCG